MDNEKQRERYTRWFGEKTAECSEKVYKVFDKITKGVKEVATNFDMNCKDDHTLTYIENDIIYVCPNFHKLYYNCPRVEEYEPYTMEGVLLANLAIIHGGAMVNGVHKVKDVKELASTSPDLAITNAHNYMRYYCSTAGEK